MFNGVGSGHHSGALHVQSLILAFGDQIPSLIKLIKLINRKRFLLSLNAELSQVL